VPECLSGKAPTRAAAGDAFRKVGHSGARSPPATLIPKTLPHIPKRECAGSSGSVSFVSEGTARRSLA